MPMEAGLRSQASAMPSVLSASCFQIKMGVLNCPRKHACCHNATPFGTQAQLNTFFNKLPWSWL